jgi:hypothetical protein
MKSPAGARVSINNLTTSKPSKLTALARSPEAENSGLSN